MSFEIVDPESETIVDNETTHSPVAVAGGVAVIDHKDDVPYFVKMLEKGVPIYNDGPSILRTSESKCCLIIIGPIIVKLKMFTHIGLQ